MAYNQRGFRQQPRRDANRGNEDYVRDLRDVAEIARLQQRVRDLELQSEGRGEETESDIGFWGGGADNRNRNQPRRNADRGNNGDVRDLFYSESIVWDEEEETDSFSDTTYLYDTNPVYDTEDEDYECEVHEGTEIKMEDVDVVVKKLQKDYLWIHEVQSLCSNISIVDNYRQVTNIRSGVRVPAKRSKWVEFIGSNSWRQPSYVEVGEDYTHNVFHLMGITNANKIKAWMPQTV